ncbi:MAG: tRNA-specific adenosine deaminase [Euryarchaeota archaeon]|jgi:tRNA(adenine34) deaminase|nr:tRNA-specific adenosine deaminase [Euryarchaeota archaeon]
MYINNYMKLALKMAKSAYHEDEVPVGAVIVKDGEVIGRGFNKVVSKNSVSAHAEIIAINNASKILNNYRLQNCEIYVTLEPCHMCTKAIIDARLNCLYFGATEPKTGAIVSIDQFLDRNDLNHRVIYSGGHMKSESSKLLKKFFQSKR